MRLNWFPRGGENKMSAEISWHSINLHKKTEPCACVCVCVCACLCFLCVYTEIKGSLRRWNCVCIEAFGSFSQRLLCCHGNACWTRVLWILQKPPFSLPTTWDLFITHTSCKTFWGRDGVQPAVNWSKCRHRLSVRGFGTVSNRPPWQCMHTYTVFARCTFTAGEASTATTFSSFVLSLCLFQQTMSAGLIMAPSTNVLFFISCPCTETKKARSCSRPHNL